MRSGSGLVSPPGDPCKWWVSGRVAWLILLRESGAERTCAESEARAWSRRWWSAARFMQWVTALGFTAALCPENRTSYSLREEKSSTCEGAFGTSTGDASMRICQNQTSDIGSRSYRRTGRETTEMRESGVGLVGNHFASGNAKPLTRGSSWPSSSGFWDRSHSLAPVPFLPFDFETPN